MKPLTQAETDQLLILLRKLWKYSEIAPNDIAPNQSEENKHSEIYIASIAKSLFSLITKKMYEQK